MDALIIPQGSGSDCRWDGMPNVLVQFRAKQLSSRPRKHTTTAHHSSSSPTKEKSRVSAPVSYITCHHPLPTLRTMSTEQPLERSAHTLASMVLSSCGFPLALVESLALAAPMTTSSISCGSVSI